MIKTTAKVSTEKQLAEEEIFAVLGHRFRLAILDLLYENVELSYTELLEMLGIDEGLLNFHLRKMRKLIRTTEEKTYMLSDMGKTAHALIRGVQDKAATREEAALTTFGIPVGVTLTASVVSRRILAFLVDAAIIMVSTGLVFDKTFMKLVSDIFRLQFGELVSELTYQTIAAYSHLFFAAYIIFTILEAYKGQTLGKFLFKIRAVKVRVATESRGRISLMDSAVRNIGKVFLLPLDILLGVVFYSRRGYLRFFDYYTRTTVEPVLSQ